jgi:hypothetical protein
MTAALYLSILHTLLNINSQKITIPYILHICTLVADLKKKGDKQINEEEYLFWSQKKYMNLSNF